MIQSHAISQIVIRDLLASFLKAKKTSASSVDTLRVYKFDLTRFVDWCDAQGVTELAQLQPDTIRDFMIYLETAGHNPGGVHLYFRCIKSFLHWAWDELEIEYRNPADKIKRPAPKFHPKPGVSIPNVKALMDACQGPLAVRDKAIMLFLLDTGVRVSELTALNIRDIDMARGSALVLHGKGDTTRVVYFGDKTRKSVNRYLRLMRKSAKPSEPLFTTEAGGRFTRFGVHAIVRRRSEEIGIDAPGMHDFRRACALQMLRNGSDIKFVQGQLGHSTVRTTERYLAVVNEDLEEAHRKSSPVDNAEW